MPNERRQPKPDLGTDNFDSSVFQAAWAYHQQIGAGNAKGNVPVEVAAFIAGACWAQLLEGGEKEAEKDI
jgi:hypothetical protein